MHNSLTVVTKDLILAVVSDSVADLMYYDRKDDEELPRGMIEAALEAGVITKQEMIDEFAKELLASGE